MVSAMASEDEFYKEKFIHCLRTNPKFKDWNLKPGFGNWNSFGACLSKSIRKLINDNNTRKECLERFGNPEKSLLKL